MTEYKVNRDNLNEKSKLIYDIVINIIKDEYKLFSLFLLLDKDEMIDKLYDYIKDKSDLTPDDIMLNAIHYSQRLALFHTI